MDDFAAFSRLVDALRPWLNDLVFVGGWAHRLYRFHPLAHPPEYRSITTKDADIAFALGAPLAGNIAAALLAAGFEQELSGDEVPPVTLYRLGGDQQGFFAEFLTPLSGSEIRRSGQPDATVRKAGVTAQKLRYLDLLLMAPWTVQMPAAGRAAAGQPVSVRLPNPVSFIAQKLLIHGRRQPPEKRAQDLLYVHDSLELFGRELAALHRVWHEEIRPTLPRRTIKTVESSWSEQFRTVTDVHRNAVRIPQDRTLTPERLRAACALGLEEIFGPRAA